MEPSSGFLQIRFLSLFVKNAQDPIVGWHYLMPKLRQMYGVPFLNLWSQKKSKIEKSAVSYKKCSLLR